MKHFLLTISLLIMPFALYASNDNLLKSKGVDQDIIVQLTPTVAQTDVWDNTKIEVTFSIPLDSSAIQKHNIKLTHLSSKTNAHISGVINYSDTDNKLTFIPSKLLPYGVYEVEIKKIKEDKEDKANKHTKINKIKYRFYLPEVINGHQLPPEPDSKINNSTLLGIDFNNNGVRDDVERKVYFTYTKNIDQLLMMQSLKTHQSMLADPDLINNALKWQAPENKNMGCSGYLFDKYDIPFIKNSTQFINNITYNTKDRIKKYMKYNQALSGGVFGVEASYEVESSCDFDVKKTLGVK